MAKSFNRWKCLHVDSIESAQTFSLCHQRDSYSGIAECIERGVEGWKLRAVWKCNWFLFTNSRCKLSRVFIAEEERFFYGALEYQRSNELSLNQLKAQRALWVPLPPHASFGGIRRLNKFHKMFSRNPFECLRHLNTLRLQKRMLILFNLTDNPKTLRNYEKQQREIKLKWIFYGFRTDEENFHHIDWNAALSTLALNNLIARRE